MFKASQIFLVLFIVLSGCSEDYSIDTKGEIVEDNITVLENISYEFKWDAPSATYYYLTRIKHKDQNGNILKLKMQLQNEKNGETVPNFAARIGNPLMAMNATMGLGGLPDDIKIVAGIQIKDGEILQELSTRNYTLGIRDDNTLLAYRPDKSAQDILDDGTNTALTVFVPLIENFESVSEDILTHVGNLSSVNPRQVIAQYENLDLLILSCGGRGYGGEGMLASDMVRILLENKVKFAANLDGGGSVCTVINGKRITKQIDGRGTLDRPRSNFLYIE